MSTTIPESVTTTTTTTSTSTSAHGDPLLSAAANSTSTTAPSSSSTSHAANPAAALDPLTQSSSTSSAAATATDLLNSVKAATISAAHSVQHGAQVAAAAVSSKAHELDAQYHISDKVSDATSHVTAALKQGNPLHAAKHATTAATIGDAERAKHEAGPLPADAHSAGTSSSTTSTTVHSSTTLGSSQSTTEKISNSASDVASHVQASLAQGNPLHAAKYASTAAMIGQAEREKHAHGPLEDEGAIKAADAASATSLPSSKV